MLFFFLEGEGVGEGVATDCACVCASIGNQSYQSHRTHASGFVKIQGQFRFVNSR